MPCAAAGAGDFVHLRAAQAAKGRIVAVGGHSHRLNVVAAQQQVGGARVVQVQVGIALVAAVDGKGIGGGRQTVGGEVAVAALRIHHSAGSGLRDEGQVAAGIGEILELLQVEAGGELRFIYVHNLDSFAADLDRGGGFADRKIEVHLRHDAGGNRSIDGGGLKARSRDRHLVLAGSKQGDAVFAEAAGSGCLGLPFFHAGDRDGGARQRRTGGIHDGPDNVAGDVGLGKSNGSRAGRHKYGEGEQTQDQGQILQPDKAH